jgi:hypothetical protein
MEHQDKTQSQRGDQDRPNRESNMEKAEGSRPRDSELPQDSELPEEVVGQSDEQAGGISNRPLDEEQGRQENLPPRGERRENWKED